MRTVSFKSVLEGAATRLGLEPSANLERNQAAALAEYIQDKLENAWEKLPWPEWTLAEERQYRNNYVNTFDYALGAEVYYPTTNKYYVAILNPPVGTIPTNTTYWAEATDLDQYVARDQSWATNGIGTVWGVYRDDPRLNFGRPTKVNWWVSSNGIQILSSTLAKVWLEFSPMPPKFTATEWSTATAYIVGDVVYYPTAGQCYVALQAGTGHLPTDAAFWQLQQFPYILAKYVKLAAVAEALKEDEAFDKASVQEALAEMALGAAMDQESESMRNRPFAVRAA